MQTADKITIMDIARLTGLSKGTVDRVLHNRGEVSPKSKKKILKVIQDLGYKPNVYASLLASSKHYTIAVLIPSQEEGSFWGLMASGIERARKHIALLGVRVETVEYDQYDSDSFDTACRQLMELEPAGVVVVPLFSDSTKNLTARLREKGIPYTFIDSKLEDPGYLAYFGMPMNKSGYLCADLLTSGRPVKEIAAVRIIRDKGNQSDPTENRRNGFMAYLQEHYPDCQVHHVFIEPDNPAKIDKTLAEFFSSHPDVRHIVMFNSRIYLVAAFLERHGICGCRVIGFDNLAANVDALRRGTVSSLIAQHPDEQVNLAIQALSDHILLKQDPHTKDNHMHMDILTRYNVEDY